MRKLFTVLSFCALYAAAQTNQFGYPVSPDASSADTGIPVKPSVSYDVTATGGASFSYPIEVPKGLPGIEPSIAITYNSQSGNGIAGYGCNISGISVISVVPKDRFHDGTAKGCKWDGTDAMTLDGARLILKSGVYGAVGSVYCTENNPYIHIAIKLYTSGNYQDIWFEVTDQDGMTYSYGQTADSRQDFVGHDGLTKTNAWYINKVQNAVGNYMTYEYVQDSLYVYPSIIQYGMNTADASLVNKVRFHYSDRYYDDTHFVLDGAKGALRKILNYIETETGNANYKRYSLSYGADDEQASARYHRLTSISVRDCWAELRKPTELTWNLVPQDQNMVETLGLTLPQSSSSVQFLSTPQFFTADVNGDGYSDIIEHIQVKENNVRYNNIYLFLSDNQSTTHYGSYQLMGQVSGDFSFHNWFIKSYAPMVGDIDGDGLNDIAIPMISSFNSVSLYFFIIYGKTGSTGSFTTDTLIHSTFNNPETLIYTMGDFNADGRADIVVCDRPAQGSLYRLSTYWGAANSTAQWTPTANIVEFPSDPKQLFSSDYNGDGMTDLMGIYEGGYKIFWNRDGSESIVFSSTDNTTGTTVTDGFRVVDGDFDGDGLADFIVNSNGGSGWNEYRNQGDGTFVLHCTHTVPVYLTCNSDNDKKNFRVIVADLNGDGKSDIFVAKALYGTPSGNFIKTHSYWLMSKNGDLLPQKYHATSVKESDANPEYYTVGDFHGLGRQELMNYGYNCLSATDANVSAQVHVYPVSGRGAGTGHLASLKDALQRTTSFSYKSMTDPTVYTRGTSSYPVVSCTLPLSAVSSFTYSQGAAGQHTTQYTYQDLKVHTAGRGLMGMSKVVAANAQQGVTTEKVIDSYDASFFVPTSTHTKTTFSDSRYTMQSASSTLYTSGNTYAVSSASQTTTEFDGLVTQKSATYDTSVHGKVLSETTVCEQHSKGASYHYTLAGGAYRPDAITYTQKHADDAASYSYTDTYSYNTLGQVTSKISFSNKSRPQTVVYSYDTFGNVTSKTLTGTAGAGLPTEYYEYDATHRFVTHRYSSSLLPSYYYSYDTWGRLTAESVVKGNVTNTTTHTYNAAGLLTSTDRPDGTCSTITYGWGSTSQQRYFVLRQGTSEPWEKTWYDNCGREVLTETVGPMGMSVTTAKSYNVKGLLSSTTIDEGSRHQQQSLTYDAQGRVLSDVMSTGESVSYSYQKLKTICTQNGLTTTKMFDPWGNLKSSQQGSVTVSYSYNSQGKPVSVFSSADNQTVMTMQYDDMGCRTQMTDADAGTVSYEYDGLNRIVNQTDARGLETTTTYNSIGQKTAEAVDTLIITYAYNTTGGGMGQLSSSSANNYTLNYGYDNLGRVSSESRMVSSINTYTYTYQYNQQGRLSSKTYPQNVTEQLEYDAYGFMSRQKVAGQTVWERTSATGTVDQYDLGGGILTRRNSYDNAGQLTETKTGLANSTSPLFQMSFGYNTLGSLSQRTLSGQSTETFTYDSYDRLLSATMTGGTQTVTYDTNGNILSKTGIGQYYYEADQPHAVSELDNTERLILLNTQRPRFNADGKIHSLTVNAQRCGTYGYGPDRERWYSEQFSGRKTIYLGDVEYICNSPNFTETWFYYLSNDVLYVKKAGVQDSVYYICRDNLGSIMRIMDANGRLAFDATYDAWGHQTVNRNDLSFFRGYTGHEMINQAGLINMNGRIYDPIMGRFLNPDNFVQLPDNPQNLNRYSYCLNNPLKYTDPSGELFGIDDFLIIVAGGALIGGIFNVATNWDNINSFGGFMSYFGVGALAGGVGAALSTVSFGVGGAIGGALTGFTSGAASGFILGGGNSILQNGNFSHFWGDAFSMAASGAISGAIAGGVMGGLSAHSEGKTFWTGKDKFVSLDISPIEPMTSKDIINSFPQDKTLSETINMSEPRSFFEGTEYSERALSKMNAIKSDYHTFPKSVEAFEKYGRIRTIIGGDGIKRMKLEIPGWYKGKNGFFEFIKEPDNTISHHFFNARP